MRINKKTELKKRCEVHVSVVGKVNRTEKHAGLVQRNRKCPDCGRYYWTCERTVDSIDQLVKDNNEEKLKLAFEIDKYKQLIERIADFNRKQKALMEDVAEVDLAI